MNLVKAEILIPKLRQQQVVEEAEARQVHVEADVEPQT